MSLPARDEDRWRRSRWVMVGLLAFATQVFLLLLVGGKQPRSPRKASTDISAGLIAEPEEVRNWQSQLALRSPVVFAQVDRKSFSGEAWLNHWRGQYQFTNWNEPPRWLAYRAGPSLEPEPAGELAAVPLLPPANPAVPPAARINPGDALLNRSIVEFIGEVVETYQPPAAEIPAWPHSDILSNSIVEVLVNPAGDTVSARLLLPGSGLKSADEYAVQWARQAHYRPRAGRGSRLSGELSAGKLIFHWSAARPKAP